MPEAQTGCDMAQAESLITAGPWLDRYATGRNDLVSEFYGPALGNSCRYDRATGYFRASFYALTRAEMASFALRGGRIRLLCSPDLEKADIQVMMDPATAIEICESSLAAEIQQILEHPHSVAGGEIFAALLLHGTLEMRLAVPDGSGIFHDKFGVFSDTAENQVSFAGSINETWRAWHPLGNHESFEVFTSWGAEQKRPVAHQEQFALLWEDRATGVRVVQPEPEVLRPLTELSRTSPQQILLKLAERRQASGRAKVLMDHQVEALRNWREAGNRGILKHATGSGKTVTALAAIREQLSDDKPALILVPSTLLLDQWAREAEEELSDLQPAILRAGGGHSKWRDLLRMFTQDGEGSRLSIATLGTAGTADFLSRVAGGDHLLLVVDEVHRAGAKGASRVLTISSGSRLGLSATPERAGDPEGTARILSYFQGIVQPEFNLADAVAAGRLCRYDYHVHPVPLTSEEADAWEEVSGEIRRLTARTADEAGRSPDFTSLDPYLKILLIQRSRIAKKAAAKPQRATSILVENYSPGSRWLVYCDDTTQLEEVREELSNFGIHSMPYFADMPADRHATLQRFERNGGIIVAIKCLDEGVDIPSVTHALIIASSKNPREFIQRRGRVLRVAPGKTRAEIHDVLVDPPESSSEDTFHSLALGEIARAIEFARHAENPSALLDLEGFAIEQGLGGLIADTALTGMEEEDGSE